MDTGELNLICLRKLVVAVYAGNRSVCHTKYTNTALTAGQLWTVKKNDRLQKLIVALQTIQDECLKNRDCEKCPFSMVKHGNSDMGAYELANHICAIKANLPSAWQIKPVGFIRLLESE